MTTSWTLLLLCSIATGAGAYSAVWFGRTSRTRVAVGEAMPHRARAIENPPQPTRRLPVTPPPAYSDSVPQPTTPQPDDRLLVLWATQVEEGERKMTLATDGCRVTWNRRCRHGHPAWIVYLNYLSLDPD